MINTTNLLANINVQRYNGQMTGSNNVSCSSSAYPFCSSTNLLEQFLQNSANINAAHVKKVEQTKDMYNKIYFS